MIRFHQLFVLLTATFLLGACGATSSRAHRDPQEVKELLDRFVLSVNEANTDDFVACFASDATAFLPSPANAMRRSGVEAIRAAVAPAFAAGPPAVPVVPRDLTIDVGETYALITFDAGTGKQHARRSLVLHRSNNQWRIQHLHASNVAEP